MEQSVGFAGADQTNAWADGDWGSSSILHVEQIQKSHLSK